MQPRLVKMVLYTKLSSVRTTSTLPKKLNKKMSIKRKRNNIEERFCIINTNENKEVNIFKTNDFPPLPSKSTFKAVSSQTKHLKLQK